MYNPANNLVFATGKIDIRALMKAAHVKARREMDAFRASRHYTDLDAKYWTYARHFQECIQWAWERAHGMQRLAITRKP